MGLYRPLVLLAIVASVSAAYRPGSKNLNVGTKFYQVFMQNFNFTTKPEYYFLMVTDAPKANVIVRVGSTETKVTVTNDEVTRHEVDVNPNEGIELESDAPIAVFALNMHHVDEQLGLDDYTTGAWMALPLEALNAEYTVLGAIDLERGHHGQLSVVATESGTSCSVRSGRRFKRTFSLDAFEAYYNDEQNDYGGALIKCNKRVSVFSGHQCLYLPKKCRACDSVVEQQLPLSALGHTHVLVSPPFKCENETVNECCEPNQKFDCAACTEFYRVMAVGEDAMLSLVRPGEQESHLRLPAGHYKDLRLKLGETAVLTASKPVAVGYYAASGLYSNQKQRTAPYFVQVQSVERYASRYVFPSCFAYSPNEQHYVTIVASKTRAEKITLNGKAILKDLTDLEVPREDLQAYRIKLDCGTGSTKNGARFVLESRDGTPFGLHLYGYSETEHTRSYGMLAGLASEGTEIGPKGDCGNVDCEESDSEEE